MNITIVGSGYVGLTTGACLANLGHHVLCVDIDAAKINLLLQGELPFYEPGLKELIQKNREAGRFSFTTTIQEGVQFGEVLFSCVGTPSWDNGSADLTAVFMVGNDVAQYSKSKKILVNKSTVPPGTAKRCHDIIIPHDPLSMVEVV